MKVYYESVVLLNFLLDYMILYGTKRILKINKKNKRLLLGGAVGSLTTFLLIYHVSSNELFLIKILLSTIMILISFGKKNFLKNIEYFYLLSIILGGIFYLFDLPQNILFRYLIIIIGSIGVITILIKEVVSYKEKIKNKYQVHIYYKKKWYNLEGFIDTGNQMTSPIKKESIILVNLNLPISKVIYVPYQTLNSRGVVACIRPDKVIIEKKNFSNCLIGLAKNKIQISGCSCILPNTFKEELC